MTTTTTQPTVKVATNQRLSRLRAGSLDRLLNLLRAHEVADPMPRHVTVADAAEMAVLIGQWPEARTLRVYSGAGFVPSSYRWPAPIEWLQADNLGWDDQQQGNVWQVTICTGDAKRPNARGPRVTINGKRALG